MIPETFLLCAMALPPQMAFPRRSQGEAIRLVLDGIRLSRAVLHISGRVLVVGGDPVWVNMFRRYGIKAFGALTDDAPGATIFHVLADADLLPFAGESFEAVHWRQPSFKGESNFKELSSVIAVIEHAGYLIFTSGDYPDWPDQLKAFGWSKVPILWSGMSIWQKPTFRDRRKQNWFKTDA